MPCSFHSAKTLFKVWPLGRAWVPMRSEPTGCLIPCFPASGSVNSRFPTYELACLVCSVTAVTVAFSVLWGEQVHVQRPETEAECLVGSHSSLEAGSLPGTRPAASKPWWASHLLPPQQKCSPAQPFPGMPGIWTLGLMLVLYALGHWAVSLSPCSCLGVFKSSLRYEVGNAESLNKLMMSSLEQWLVPQKVWERKTTILPKGTCFAQKSTISRW